MTGVGLRGTPAASLLLGVVGLTGLSASPVVAESSAMGPDRWTAAGGAPYASTLASPAPRGGSLVPSAPTLTHGAPAAAAGPATPALSAAAAHLLGQSYIYLRIYDDSLIIRIEIERKDIAAALDLDWDLDQPYDQSLVDRDLEAILDYVGQRFYLETDEGRLDFNFRHVDALSLEFADFIRLTYELDDRWEIPEELNASLSVFFDVNEDHRNFLLVEHNWLTATFNNEASHSLIFSPRNPSGRLDLTSSSLFRGFIGFIGLGVWHILIGTDHILFLLALILTSVLRRDAGRWVPVDDFKTALINIVAIVTFFTIAHSVTLSMAALDLINVPSRPIETVIALSIAVAAWANLMPGLKIREWTIAFVFGLFHGFGFATVMGAIGVGREHLLLSLVGFNLGVEVGQVAIICLVFPVLFLLRATRIYLPLVKWGSLLLIGIASLWVVERLFGFDVPLRRTARNLWRSLFGGGVA